MKRKALIISNPGEIGADNYCEGVNRDVNNYFRFFQAPYGGLWRFDEIQHLHQPSTPILRNSISELKYYEYSIIVFSGHGYYDSDYGSTMIEINKLSSINSNELMNASPKQTVILDCCRKVWPVTLLEERMVKFAAKAANILNEEECLRLYNQRISDCSNSRVILHSCKIDQEAYDDSEKGGYYSYSLIQESEEWKEQTLRVIDLNSKYNILSVVAAHDFAVPKVIQKSSNNQYPQIEKPRSGDYFPFCIVA